MIIVVTLCKKLFDFPFECIIGKHIRFTCEKYISCTNTWDILTLCNSFYFWWWFFQDFSVQRHISKVQRNCSSRRLGPCCLWRRKTNRWSRSCWQPAAAPAACSGSAAQVFRLHSDNLSRWTSSTSHSSHLTKIPDLYPLCLPPQETLKELQAFISNNEIVQDSPDSTEETKSHDASGSEAQGDPPSKRAKLEHCSSGDASKEGTVTVETQADEESHVCVACLGVLQEFCDVTQATKVCEDVVKHCSSQLKMALIFFSPLSTDGSSGEGTTIWIWQLGVVRVSASSAVCSRSQFAMFSPSPSCFWSFISRSLQIQQNIKLLQCVCGVITYEAASIWMNLWILDWLNNE